MRTLIYLSAMVAAVPRADRTPQLPEPRTLVTTTLQAGAVQATLTSSNVRGGNRSIVNGSLSDGDADVFVRLELVTRVDQVLGLHAAGEAIPYQSVSLRVENLATHDVVQFPLHPWVSNSGWSYGSNVKLPPVDRASNPFQDTYRIAVTTSSDPAPVLLADALPPSSLWRSNGDITLMLADVHFGPVGSLPVGDVSALVDEIEAYGTIHSGLVHQDLSGLAQQYVEHVQGFFTELQDPTIFAPERQLTAGVLQDLDENVLLALLGQPVRGECNGVVEECAAWADASLQRGFILGVVENADRAVKERSLDAWDRAFALRLAFRSEMLIAESACQSGPPFAPGLQDCAIASGLDEAFVTGANALLDGGSAAEARDLVVKRVLKFAYYGLMRDIVEAVRGRNVGARPAAHARFLTISQYIPFGERHGVEMVLADPGGITEYEARDVVIAVNFYLMEQGFTVADLVDPDDMLEVL